MSVGEGGWAGAAAQWVGVATSEHVSDAAGICPSYLRIYARMPLAVPA